MFQFDADLPSLDDGVWTSWSGSEFKIAHISNLKFQRALARLQQPHRKKLESGTLDPKTNREIVCKAMAGTVLVDWKNVVARSGESTPFTVEAAVVALMRNSEFRDFVSEFAMNMANYRDEEVQELGKP